MKDWKEYRFSEFLDINPLVSLKGSEDFSFVEMKDLEDGKKFCYPKVKRKASSGSRFKNGDTLFARITPCLENGKICQVQGLDNEIGFGSTEFLVFRGKEGISDRDFVYYLSRWDEVRNFAENNFEGTSGRQRVPKSCFYNLSLFLPSITEQRFIASLLSGLDSKIDLLNEQNKTLEKLAEIFFRKWFIDDVDENWPLEKIDNLVILKGGTTPSTENSEYWNGDVNWVTPRDLSNIKSMYLFQTDRKISEAGLMKIGSGLLPIGTLLLSSRAPIGYLTITSIPVAINQGFIAICCDKSISNYFMYLWCKANLELIQNSGNGSVFQEISKTTFRSLEIICPPKNVLQIFDSIVEPFFRKIESNFIQIRTLDNLKDKLLPKLVDGSIKIY